jgi:hypothetical protein
VPGTALRLPDSKTGAKVVHLGQPAIEVLENIGRLQDNPWVIVGTLSGGRLSDLQPFWQRVRARAGLKDVWPIFAMRDRCRSARPSTRTRRCGRPAISAICASRSTR